MATLQELISWIDKSERVCVIPHISPDGDCLGSALALCKAMEKMGKRARVAVCDAVPEMYSFLPALELMCHPDALPFEPDGVLFVDVAAIDRAGDRGLITSKYADNWALVDHHGTNGGFAPTSYIDADASATGIVVSRLFDLMGVEIDETIATLLYVAISTDTGNFSFPNTTPEALNITAKLMRTGFDLANVNRLVFRLRTLPRVKLLGDAINAMKILSNGRVAVTFIDQAMFDRCHASHEHTEGIVNCLADIAGVEIAMTVEARDGGESTKFSMRSNNEIDVAKIARSFGGGGHKAAAGMNMPIPVEKAGPIALKAVLDALEA